MIDDIRRSHELDAQVIDAPFPNKQLAVLMLQQAHQHRDLLLAEVERLREQLQRGRDLKKAIR